jgi:uncharacterized protein YneF (UPF0154 family)
MLDDTSDDVVSSLTRLTQTVFVLCLLAVAALVFSYLGAFAVTSALVSADLMEHWPINRDPRPRWMMLSFSSLTAAFCCVGAVLKWSSWRQMKRLDATCDDEIVA